MKQTAVEWLVKQLTKTINYDDSANAEDLRIKLYSLIIDIEKQAKAMEKEQIIDAYEEQNVKWEPEFFEDGTMAITNKFRNSEQYYNETFKSK